MNYQAARFQLKELLVERAALNKKMTSSLRILLVEKDELYRLGLRIGLQIEGLAVVAEATDGEMAVRLAREMQPDVVILDLGLPGIGGIEACRQMKQQQSELPILVLTSRFQKSLIVRLIEVGVQGFCLKGVSAKVLVLALRSLAAGASWWDETGSAQIREFFLNYQSSSNSNATQVTLANPLTKREQEVLTLLAMGKTNQEIAQMLYITPGTVRLHVHSILQKLEVRDRTQAALVALQNNLVDVTLIREFKNE